MYSSVDYISIGEVLSRFTTESNIELEKTVKTLEGRQFRDAFLENVMRNDGISWNVLRYFSQQPSFSACLPSGGIVKLSPSFLQTSRPPKSDDSFAFHPCLSASGYYLSVEGVSRLIKTVEKYWSKPSSIMTSASLQHMRAKILPLDGASIQIHIRHNPKSLDDLSLNKHAESFVEADIISEIIKFSDQGMRRDDIKRVLCPMLPIESWRAVWKEAAKLKPEITRSGPKPRHSVRN